MIKVAHIDTGLTYRGGQRQVQLLMQNLPTDGVEQHLMCPADSPLVALCRDCVTSHYDIGRTNLIRLLGRVDLRQYIEDRKIEIIHAHDSHAHSLAVLISPKGKLARIVVTRRSAGKIKFGSRSKYLANNIIYVAISDYVRSLLIKGGVDEDKIYHIPSMLDLSKYNDISLKQNDQRTETTIIISAGAMDKSKGFGDVIKAMRRLREKRDDFEYHLYGDGPEKRKIEKYITANNMHDYVKLPGWVENSREYMRAADMFVTASCYEGLNSSLIEAMASGLPVVASDIPPHREIISDNETGCLFRTGDIGDLCDKVANLLDDRDRARSLAKAAAGVAQKYDCGGIAAQIYKLYRQIVA